MTSSFGNALDRSLVLGGGPSTPPRPQPGAELIIGPYRSGKTCQLIAEVIAAAQNDPFNGALVVVPSHRYAMLFQTRLQEQLRQSGGEGLVGVRVVTFYNACQLILRRAGRPFRLIPEHVRPAIVARVLNKLIDDGALTTLEPLCKFAGTHASLLDLIDELERAALAPPEVLGRLSKTAQSESRFTELARIYSAYWDELSALGYSDERGLAFEARQLLTRTRDKLDLPFTMLAVDGFDRFNMLQLDVLSGLAAVTPCSRITFDHVSPESDVGEDYIWKDHSYKELISKFHHARLRFVAGARVQSSPAMVKARTVDRFLEAANAARSIKERIVEGVPADQFLVVARSVEKYSAALEAAFEDAGISHFIDRPIALAALPVVQHIRRLLTLAAQGYSRAEMISVLRSPFFAAARIGCNERDVARLARLSVERNVVGGQQQWESLLKSCSDKLSREFVAAVQNLIVDTAPIPLASLRQHVAWAEDLLDKYFNIGADPNNDPQRVWEQHRSLLELRRLFASLVQEDNITGPVYASDQFFMSRLTTLIDKANFRTAPPSQAAVTICGADLAPNRTFEEVYILGMTEGEFPRRPRQTGFLSSDEVERWLTYAVDIRNPRFHPAFESALFNSLVQRARTRAILSCPVFELSGEELVPSYLLTAGDEQGLATTAPFFASGEKPVSARDALSGLLWMNPSANPDDLRSMLPLTTISESLSEPIGFARARGSRERVALMNGDLRELTAAGAMTIPLPQFWSATKLNEYGKCPFRYWVSHVMSAEPWEEPTTGITPMVLGETYHKALELFYRALADRKLTLTSALPEETNRLFQSAAAAALALLEQKEDVRRSEFYEYDRNEILFRLNRFFAREQIRAQLDQEQFTPVLLEAAFGMDFEPQSAPALVINGGKRQIKVRGRIDRIDVSAATMNSDARRVRIIDYKSGSSPISKNDAFSGRNIQLPLYALAVERSIMPGSKVISGMYLSVSSGEPSGRLSFAPAEANDVTRSDESNNLFAIVEQHVGDTVNGIACGDFSVRPNIRSICIRCPHRQVCRIKELPDSQD